MRKTVSKWLIDCRGPALSTWLMGAIVIALTVVLPSRDAIAGDYHAYAVGILKTLPKEAAIRPDLEAYLDALADRYRVENGRGGVIGDELMRIAARAQAADMMLAGKTGHVSRNGYAFGSRFAAFVDKADLFRARGENAASDRRKGPADAAKARRLFALWLDSSAHRRNLMSRDYEFVSTGVIQRRQELWAVQIFWSRRSEPNLLTQ